MEIYKFRCKNCGSSKCERLNETIFKCAYCGEIEEIIYEKTKAPEEPKAAKSETINQNSSRKTQEDIEINRVPHKSEDKRFEEKPKDFTSLKKSIITFVVCIIFGYLGIHRFMQRKFITGMIYFFTFGLFCVGWGIDCIISLCRLLSEAFVALGGEK